MRSSGIPGTAVVLTQVATSSFAIENLSATGALLVGDLVLAPSERIKLLLHIDGERPLGVTAEVVRIQSLSTDRSRVAVRFHEVEFETQAWIQNLVLSAIDRQWITADPAILVVDDEPATCIAAERDLRVLGWTVVSAASSVEVVRWLRDRSVRFEAALVEACLDRINSLALLGQLADEHPRIRRVLVSKRVPSRDDENALVSNALVSACAHAFLQKPWDPDMLMDAIGALDRTDKAAGLP